MSDSKWRRYWAWHPVRTLSGRRVWGRYVERRWNSSGGMWHGDFSGYSEPAGCWEYRMPCVHWLWFTSTYSP